MIIRALLLLCIFTLSTSLNAQTNLIDSSRYIKVSGSAEIEISPNKIIIAAYLTERMEKKEKIQLSSIEAKFNNIINTLGIDKSKVLLDKASGDYTQIKKRRYDVMASKVMLVELNDIVLANRFLDALKDVDISNTIRQKTHTELSRFRKETKIEAVKAARDKAAYLIEAAGSKIGKVLRVIESPEGPLGVRVSQSNRFSNSASNLTLDNYNIGSAFSPIKMRYEMEVIYEIID